MMKSHVFCNSVGVYMVCTCKLSEPDLSTLMPEHVTHKLQNEFFSQEAVSDQSIVWPQTKCHQYESYFSWAKDYM